MLVTIHTSRPVGGTITAPPSKSMAHRAVLCAALADGRSHITNLEFSKDISATLGAAGQLCAAVHTGASDAVWRALGILCRSPHRWTAVKAAAPCGFSSPLPA